MLSNDELNRIRRMTNSERLEMTLRMTSEGLAAMFEGPSDVVDRRFELLRRQNDERNRLMWEGLARAQRSS